MAAPISISSCVLMYRDTENTVQYSFSRIQFFSTTQKMTMPKHKFFFRKSRNKIKTLSCCYRWIQYWIPLISIFVCNFFIKTVFLLLKKYVNCLDTSFFLKCKLRSAFQPLHYLYTPWKHEKTDVFLCFQGV